MRSIGYAKEAAKSVSNVSIQMPYNAFSAQPSMSITFGCNCGESYRSDYRLDGVDRR